MTTDVSKGHAKDCLAAQGFTVEEIPPVPGKKRADLRALWGGEEYIFEAKGREETDRWRSLVAEVAEKGLATTSRRTEPWSAISGMIRRSYEQLEATPGTPSTFRILWVVAFHNDGQFVIDCVEKRLFGLEKLTAIRSTQGPVVIMPCYYYSHADFARFPGLDAAVLSMRHAGFLCVNSFSPKRDALRHGRLYSLLAAHRAVRDPEMLEQKGVAFLIDGNLDRGPNGGQWEFLRTKYGYGTSKMIDEQFDGLLSVPGDLLGGD